MKSVERGTIAVDPSGAYATLTFRRRYAHPPERVWEAISTPEGLAGWLFAHDVTIEPRVGGVISMISGPAGYRSVGTILVWDPPRALAYDWRVEPVPEMPRGEHGTFRYELARVDGDTDLVVTVERITVQTAGGFLPGQHAFLDRLAAQLDGAEPIDWFARFAELRAVYPAWSHG